MRSVKIIGDVMGVGRAAADRWYVTNGITAVGPVNFELLTRGIQAGKVPIESFIRHEAWKVWRPLSDVAVVTNEQGVACVPAEQTPIPGPVPMADLTSPGGPMFLPSRASATAMVSFERAPASTDAQPFSTEALTMPRAGSAACAPAPPPVDEVTSPRGLDLGGLSLPVLADEPTFPGHFTRSAKGVPNVPSDEPTTPGHSPFSVARATGSEPLSAGRASPPVEAAPLTLFDGCDSLPDALLLLLSTAVEQGAAQAAILHQIRDGGAVVLCAHGLHMFDMLGQRTQLLDPALMAAASGMCVVAEPSPGPAGHAIVARLARLGIEVVGALMIPIRPHGRFFGALEIGRGWPFLPREVAAIEGLVSALTARIEASRWAAD